MSQKKMEAYKNAKKNKKELEKKDITAEEKTKLEQQLKQLQQQEADLKTNHQLDLRYCDRPSDRWRMWLSGLLY